MVRPRICSQAWRLIAPAPLTVAGVLVAMNASSAGQLFNREAKLPLFLERPAPSGAIQGVVDSVFRNRWLGSSREYTAGIDGKIQTAASLPADDYARVAKVAVTSERDVDDHSHFDLSITETETSCGPSPLTASAIARLVVQVARHYGVNPDFALAIAATESRLDRDRNSPKGARGPMQLMPSTAASLGVRDICDPVENIDGGVRFLKSLFATYRNPLIVAAAYNAGEATVQRYGGMPPFPETVRFVAEVVNRQLGLPAPGIKGEGTEATAVSITDDNDSTGVLATVKSRQWVGGVMQF